MNPLVIYHANCADGFAAAWTFRSRFGADKADFHPAKYGQPMPSLAGRPQVYITDFSYPPEVLLAAMTPGQQVHVLDHHLSAARTWLAWLEATGAEFAQETDPAGALQQVVALQVGPDKNLNLHFDMNRSGATLAWDFNFPTVARPALLGHIEDRDLWRFKLAGTEHVQGALFSYPYDFETWDGFMRGGKVALTKLTAAGQAIMRKHHKDVEELAAAATRLMWIGGRQVPVCNVPYMMASDMGHLLAEQYRASLTKGLPEDKAARVAGDLFAATYYDDATHRCFSLRSLDDGADVSAIAVSYGGGGHKHAAGFKVTRDHALARA